MNQRNDGTLAVTGVGAGALATITVWILDAFCKVKVPPEVATAFTTLLIVIAGWFVPKAKSEAK